MANLAEGGLRPRERKKGRLRVDVSVGLEFVSVVGLEFDPVGLEFDPIGLEFLSVDLELVSSVGLSFSVALCWVLSRLLKVGRVDGFNRAFKQERT